MSNFEKYGNAMLKARDIIKFSDAKASQIEQNVKMPCISLRKGNESIKKDKSNHKKHQITMHFEKNRGIRTHGTSKE